MISSANARWKGGSGSKIPYTILLAIGACRDGLGYGRKRTPIDRRVLGLEIAKRQARNILNPHLIRVEGEEAALVAVCSGGKSAQSPPNWVGRKDPSDWKKVEAEVSCGECG